MPKLLWVSQFNLFDTSSGAAISCKKILEQLAKRGIEVVVLGGFIFDTLKGALTTFSDLENIQKDVMNKKALKAFQNNITYFFIPTSTTAMGNLAKQEEDRIFEAFLELIKKFDPDVCMGYGMGCFGMSVHNVCKRLGIPHVYPLRNANHPFYNFWDCDLLFTDCEATSYLYAKRDRLNVVATGCFIDPDEFVASTGTHEYITMINPEPRKGVSVFAKIALMAKNDPELKGQKFLCVSSRGDFATSVGMLKDRNKKGRKYSLAMFDNVSIAQNTKDMKSIYGISKLVIAPSVPEVGYESFGRVAAEAALNRIPVLVSKNGGLPEATGGAGIALDVPKALHKDPTIMPSDEEIKPWIRALKELLAAKSNDNKEELSFWQWRECENELWRQRFDEAAKRLDIERSTDNLLAALEPLFEKRKKAREHNVNSKSVTL